VDQIFCGDRTSLLSGELIRCQGNHDVYACSHGGVAMLGGDKTGYQLSSACCQAHVGACGYVMSCMALNDRGARGFWLFGHLPDIEDPWAWLPGAGAHAEPGHKEELDGTDRWQDSARPWLLRWDKMTGIGCA
jgi:hypothetical protein